MFGLEKHQIISPPVLLMHLAGSLRRQRGLTAALSFGDVVTAYRRRSQVYVYAHGLAPLRFALLCFALLRVASAACHQLMHF
jgi:hypothetical protein